MPAFHGEDNRGDGGIRAVSQELMDMTHELESMGGGNVRIGQLKLCARVRPPTRWNSAFVMLRIRNHECAGIHSDFVQSVNLLSVYWYGVQSGCRRHVVG